MIIINSKNIQGTYFPSNVVQCGSPVAMQLSTGFSTFATYRIQKQYSDSVILIHQKYYSGYFSITKTKSETYRHRASLVTKIPKIVCVSHCKREGRWSVNSVGIVAHCLNRYVCPFLFFPTFQCYFAFASSKCFPIALCSKGDLDVPISPNWESRS